MKFITRKNKVIFKGKTFDDIRQFCNLQIKEGDGFCIVGEKDGEFYHESTWWKSTMDDEGSMSSRGYSPSQLITDTEYIEQLGLNNDSK